MSPICWIMLLLLSSKDKKNLQIDCRCPLCGERYRVTRHGHYWRYSFDSATGQIAIQRYCCGNPDCPRKTFSILPSGLLPYCRIPLCILLQIYHHHFDNHHTVSQCARRLNIGWSSVKRALNRMVWTLDLVRDEIGGGSLPPTPFGPGVWPRFIRVFSYAFFPERLSL
ncbi:MAG: transposase family protein [Desulfobacterales bacterium]|nr:transposase family protein [Desulfobacterales bacterium]